MNTYWFAVIVCITATLMGLFILARFIENLEAKVKVLEDKVENLKIKRDMMTRIISEKVERELLDTCESLTDGLRNNVDKNLLIPKMEKANKLLSKAIQEMGA